jgi:hypothetical protein
MVKNIGPLAAKGKGTPVSVPDFFQGLVGHYAETPRKPAVNPGYDIFTKKDMEYLGRHNIK